MPDVNINVKTRGAKKAESSFQKIGKSLVTMAAATIAVQKGWELLKKAGQLEGVENAFKRTGISLHGLRTAVRGTIADFDLMQQAVIATNLGVGDLETLFKFASIRARETGQEIDYIVESIVGGIGKKSTMVLDNVGISLVAMQNEMKKVGSFAEAAGNIIEREIGGMDENVGQVADQTDRIAAGWQNAYDGAAKFIGIMAKFGPIVDMLDDYIRRMDLLLLLMDILSGKYETTADRAEAAFMTQVRAIQERTKTELAALALVEQKESERYTKLKQQIIDIGLAQLDIMGMPEDEPIDRMGIERSVEALEELKKIAPAAFAELDLEELKKIAPAAFAELDKNMSQVVAHWDVLGNTMISTFDYVFTETLIREQNFADAMVAGLESMFAKMAASIAARSAVFGLFSMFGGGGLLTAGGTALDFLTGGLFSHDGAGLSPRGGGSTVNINMPNVAMINSKSIRQIKQAISRDDRLH
jgi:hypothetical protein